MGDIPRYEHDCTACVFLGQYNEYDLYFCPHEPTLIARRSSEDGDYRSGIVFALCNEPPYPLCEALRRALRNPEHEKLITDYVMAYQWPEYQRVYLRVREEVRCERQTL